MTSVYLIKEEALHNLIEYHYILNKIHIGNVILLLSILLLICTAMLLFRGEVNIATEIDPQYKFSMGDNQGCRGNGNGNHIYPMRIPMGNPVGNPVGVPMAILWEILWKILWEIL